MAFQKCFSLQNIRRSRRQNERRKALNKLSGIRALFLGPKHDLDQLEELYRESPILCLMAAAGSMPGVVALPKPLS